MLHLLEEHFRGLGYLKKSSIWKGCIQEMFWLLPSVAQVSYSFSTQVLCYPNWGWTTQTCGRQAFILCIRPERGSWESTSTDLACKSSGVGKRRLSIASVVRKNHSGSVLNWPPCDQFACWISIISTFYIEGNTPCPLNVQGQLNVAGYSLVLLHLPLLSLGLYTYWESVRLVLEPLHASCTH